MLRNEASLLVYGHTEIGFFNALVSFYVLARLGRLVLSKRSQRSFVPQDDNGLSDQEGVRVKEATELCCY